MQFTVINEETFPAESNSDLEAICEALAASGLKSTPVYSSPTADPFHPDAVSTGAVVLL